jgi:hypothetical protein
VRNQIASDPKPIDIAELPPPPADYIDAVGSFKVSADVSPKTLDATATATVTLKIEGEGALDRMGDIKLAPPGFKIYADKPQFDETKRENAAPIFSKKQLKYALVPTASGTFELGDLAFSTFDPIKGAYVTHKIPLGSLTVSGDATSSPVASTVAPSQTSSIPTRELLNQPAAPSKVLTKIVAVGDVLIWISVCLFLLGAVFIAWPRANGRGQRETKSSVVLLKETIRRAKSPEMLAEKLRSVFATQGQDPNALTSADIEEICIQNGTPNAVAGLVGAFFLATEKRSFGQGSDEEVQAAFQKLREARIGL